LVKEFDKIEKARSASESSEHGTTLQEDSGCETLLEIDSEIDSEYLDWAITTSADDMVT